MSSIGPEQAEASSSVEPCLPDTSWRAWRRGIAHVALFALAVGGGIAASRELADRWIKDKSVSPSGNMDVKKQQIASVLSIAAETESFCFKSPNLVPQESGAYYIREEYNRLVFTGNELDIVLTSKASIDELYVCGTGASVRVDGSIGKLGIIGSQTNLNIGSSGRIEEVYQAGDDASGFVSGYAGTYMLGGEGSVAKINGTLGSGIIDGRNLPGNFFEQRGAIIVNATVDESQA